QEATWRRICGHAPAPGATQPPNVPAEPNAEQHRTVTSHAELQSRLRSRSVPSGQNDNGTVSRGSVNVPPSTVEDDGKRKVRVTGTSDADEPAAEPVWTPDQERRRDECLAGKAVVANRTTDKALIAWANAEGLLVWIDRTSGSAWGNPFI